MVEAALAIALFSSDLFSNFVDTKGFEGFSRLNSTNPELLRRFEENAKCCGWDSYNDTYAYPVLPPNECYPNGIPEPTKVYPPCHQVINDFFSEHLNIVIGVVVSVLLTQIIGEVMAVCMWRNINQESMYV